MADSISTLLDGIQSDVQAIRAQLTPAWPRTDRTPQPKPALPVIPAAGGRFVDPSFGSTILRVTDANTQPGVVTSYRSPSEPMNRAWSADGRKFYVVMTAGGVQLFDFDPVAFTATPREVLTYDAEPEFSRCDPDAMLGRWYRGPDAEAIIQAYRCDTKQYQTIVGVRDLVPNVDANGRTYLRGYNTGGSEWLCFTFGGTSQDQDHYVAYFLLANRALTAQILDTVAGTINGVPIVGAPFTWGFKVHATFMDHSGRYVVVGPVQSQPYNNIVWDTMTNVFTPMTVHGGGHGAPGYRGFISMPDDNDGMQTLYRSLATPDVVTELISPYPVPGEFQMDTHVSWASARFSNDAYALASTYRYGTGLTDGIWREWDDEIIAISPIPTLVQRFCHHRSDVRHDTIAGLSGFWYTPRVNVSPDGRFAMFTSNWEKTLGADPGDAAEGCGYRQDVFVVKLTR